MKNLKTLNNNVLVWLKISVFLLALIPLTKLAINIYLDNLGANPIEKITHVTGYWTLTFLLITLTITPLRRLTGWLWLVRLRRLLGLFAFFYACLHFSTYLVLDQFFDWASIAKDIVKRPYITVGFSAFVLLIPLAITSNDRSIKLIGGKRWLLLQRLIYPITIGGVVHFWWLVKKDITEPLIFAGLLSLLLVIRLFYVYTKSK
ncbi:MAG: sulfoxide reductase heme-binding subunit YedZ [Methylococcaceae bacterium]|nr:sulfoxide reductase heme-binding subunit YedZ [Methylococcaceae bacterium]MDD1615321.1 sulfoxide reductase heme-binding subunit YedZ [Methylococcaceae bacterium]MDD1626369.1 sulfoxide reductase heme-binding subunit YedZ [Methylococcaceae bacterium]OYV20609.1 MAG: sulfoxide reductase heme-binding subunit yedZ [Methylococcaceae bacterium NSP1-2]